MKEYTVKVTFIIPIMAENEEQAKERARTLGVMFTTYKAFDQDQGAISAEVTVEED